jgi:hypothetical protein
MSELAEMKVILENMLKSVKNKLNGDLGGDEPELPAGEEPSSEVGEMESEEPMGEDDPMAEIEEDQKKYFSNDKPKEEKKGGFRGSFAGMSESQLAGNPFKKRGK